MIVALAAVSSPAPIADSTSTTSGPIVVSSRAEAEADEDTVVTIDGFSSPYVVISICGNEARRGSADCNLSASEGVEIKGDEPLVLRMPLSAPPADCPCIIRVVGKDTGEIAVTPIVLVDHPVGPLVDPLIVGDLVTVSIVARETPEGAMDALRSALGGETKYLVTVRVKNLAPTPLRQVKVSASAGRGDDGISLAKMEFEDAGLIGVGQTWQQTLTVSIPSPAIGTTEWRAVASGAGRSVVGTRTTEHRPWLFVILCMFAAANTSLLLIRWRVRRRVARAAEQVETLETEGSTEPTPVDALLPESSLAGAFRRRLATMSTSAR